MFDLEPIREFPRVDDGGGPAGVVEILLNGLCGLSGVEGGLETGNLNDISYGASFKQVEEPKLGNIYYTKQVAQTASVVDRASR